MRAQASTLIWSSWGAQPQQASTIHLHPGRLLPMVGAGQGLWDHCPSFYGGGQGGTKVAPTCRTRPKGNFWRALHVDSKNIQSLSDDYWLPYQSNELRVNLVALAETWRTGSGEISWRIHLPLVWHEQRLPCLGGWLWASPIGSIFHNTSEPG